MTTTPSLDVGASAGRASSSSKRKPHVDRCLNCGAATPSRFCPDCGQEAVDASVSVGDQVADFLSEVVSLEERLPRTAATLIARPGALTRDYNAGQRVRHVTPLKLYLFASVAYFLVASLAPSTIHVGNAMGAPLDAAETARVLADTASWPAFLQTALRRLLESPAGLSAALLDTMSKATLVLVPIHALLLKGVYRRPARLYGEHVIFSLHVHAFGYLAFTAASLIDLACGVEGVSGLGALVAVAIYLVVAARTAYREGPVRSLFKTVVVGFGYGVALLFVALFALAIAIFRV
jgi:hypothetical protein